MSTPAPITQYFENVLFDELGAAYLCLDRDRRILDAGGRLDVYGLAVPRPGVAISEYAPQVAELLSSLDAELAVTQLKIRFLNGQVGNLHFFGDDDQVWLLIVATIETEQPHEVDQQRAHGSAEQTRHAKKILDLYLGQKIARPVATNDEDIGDAEKSEVSVLFADLRGFTSFCEAHEAASSFTILNQYLEQMIAPIVRRGGVVDKIIGDAVMAIFGLGEEVRDREKETIEAAREMIIAADKVTESLPTATADSDNRIEGVGVGITSGEIALGVIGSERRRSFTIIGHRVNLSARLQSQAKAGEILIDINTWHEIDDLQPLFRSTELWLKGIPRPVPVMTYSPIVGD